MLLQVASSRQHSTLCPQSCPKCLRSGIRRWSTRPCTFMNTSLMLSRGTQIHLLAESMKTPLRWVSTWSSCSFECAWLKTHKKLCLNVHWTSEPNGHTDLPRSALDLGGTDASCFSSPASVLPASWPGARDGSGFECLQQRSCVLLVPGLSFWKVKWAAAVQLLSVFVMMHEFTSVSRDELLSQSGDSSQATRKSICKYLSSPMDVRRVSTVNLKNEDEILNRFIQPLKESNF